MPSDDFLVTRGPLPWYILEVDTERARTSGG
jgi:hypothetical protein